MQNLHEVLLDIQQNWMLYASMPFVAAIIGFGTKIVAIRMMFQPIEFVGIKPPLLGWQGIVPRKAAVMAAIAKPFVVFAVGSSKYQEMKRLVAEEIMKRLPAALKHIESYAEDAMDLEHTLAGKMTELSIGEFENLLHPAFEQDEWILIAVGAALGFVVGELQVLVMEHLATHVHIAAAVMH